MTTITALPSRYVKRCPRCRVVKGNSSFAGSPGRRLGICRDCAEMDRTAQRNDRKLARLHEKHRALRITSRMIRLELQRVRLAIRELEAVPTVGGIVPKQRSA